MKHVAQKSQSRTGQLAKGNVLSSKEMKVAAGFPFLLLCAYFIADLIPQGEVADVMGSQWLYLCGLNLVAAGYFFLKKHYGRFSSEVLGHPLFLLHLLLLVLSVLSVTVALNKIESLLVLSRSVIVLSSILHVSMLLFLADGRLKVVMTLLACIVALQVLLVLYQFFRQFGEETMNNIIFNLKLNTGNKNILAASIAIKLPAVLYLLMQAKGAGRWILSVLVMLLTIALVFLNARAGLLSILTQAVAYLFLCFLLFRGSKHLKLLLQRAGSVLLPLIAGMVIANGVLGLGLSMEKDKDQAYGTVGSRLSTIALTDEASNARFPVWRGAIDYIGKHPLMGAGIGNYKIESIQYEKLFSNDFLISYHVHNDFLETTAELGWGAALLLLAIYALIFYSVFRMWKRRVGDGDPIMTIALFALLAGVSYFIDAFFNFPMERPTMQVSWVLLAAVIIRYSSPIQRPAWIKPVRMAFPVVNLAFLFVALFFSIKCYQSLRAQYLYNGDLQLAKPRFSANEVIEELPSIPNMNGFGFVVDDIKAKYLVGENRYDEARLYLSKAEHLNPYLSFHEFVKGLLYLNTGKVDSARLFAVKAFDLRPRCLANLQLVNRVALKLSDSALLGQTFRTFTSSRKEPIAFSEYVSLMSQMGHYTPEVGAAAREGYRLFPDNEDVKRNHLHMNNRFTPEVQVIFERAMKAFAQQDYDGAKKDFQTVAAMLPQSYTASENMALCYFLTNETEKAQSLFERAVTLGAPDGKSEFFIGECLLKKQKTTEACDYYRKSALKGYKDAAQALKRSCGK